MEKKNLSVPVITPSRVARVPSPKKATASRRSTRSRGVQFTLSFDRMTTGELEPFATCKFSDIADFMARAVVGKYEWPVVLTANHSGHLTQRYRIGSVMRHEVVRDPFTALGIAAKSPQAKPRTRSVKPGPKATPKKNDR